MRSERVQGHGASHARTAMTGRGITAGLTALLCAAVVGVASAAPTSTLVPAPTGTLSVPSAQEVVATGLPDDRLAAGPLPTLQPIVPSPSPSTPPPTPPAEPRTVPPADRWALVIGVTDYRSPVKDTVAGAADARLVRDVLLRNGWRADRIRLLTDGAATGSAVRAGLAWLAERSGPETFSLVHYSGHVKQRGGHEYLWPADNDFLSDSALVTAVRRLRGPSWTSISGCEADGFDDGLSSRQRLFTASSAVDEKSYEHPEWGTSVWTGILFAQGLRDGDADRDGDGRVSVQDAARWGAPRAAVITERQRPHGPQHPVLAGGSGPLYLDAPPRA